MGVLTQVRNAGGNTFQMQIAEQFYSESKAAGKQAAEHPGFFAKVSSFFSGAWRGIKFKYFGSSIGKPQAAQFGIHVGSMALKQIPIPSVGKDVFGFIVDQGTTYALQKYNDKRIKTIDKEKEGPINFKNYNNLVSQRNESLWRKKETLTGALEDMMKLSDDLAVLNREIIKDIQGFNGDPKKKSCDHLAKLIAKDQTYKVRMNQLRSAILVIEAYAHGVSEFVDSYAAERVANKYDLADSLVNYFSVTDPAHHWKVCNKDSCYYKQHGIK